MGAFDPGQARGSKLSAAWRHYVRAALGRSPSPVRLEAAPTAFVCGRSAALSLRFAAAEGLPPGGFVLFDLPQGWGGCASEKDEGFIAAAGAVTAVADPGQQLPVRIVSRGSRLSIIEVSAPDGAAPGCELTVRLPSLLPCERPGSYELHALASSPDLLAHPVAAPRLVVRPGAFEGFDLLYPSTSNARSAFALAVRARGGPESAYASVPADAQEIELEAEGVAGLPHEGRLRVGGPTTRVHGLRLTLPQGRLRARWQGGGATGPPVIDTSLTGGHEVLFGDLHLHTGLSDGMGGPDEAYDWARQQAGLDFVALNDHIEDRLTYGEAWNEEQWRALFDRADAHDDPGRFVTLPGIEVCGSINLYFGDRSFPYYPFQSLDADPGEIPKLLAMISSAPGALFGYHKLQTLPREFLTYPAPAIVEVIQQKREPAEALEKFLPLCSRPPAFVGGSDSHDGLAGSPPMGRGREGTQYGLAGLLAEDRSRAGVFRALRLGRTFATAGQRTILVLKINGVLQGGVCICEPGRPLEVSVLARACSRVEKLELVCLDRVFWQQSPERCDVDAAATLADSLLDEAPGGCFVFARLVEQDGRRAWSSPILVRRAFGVLRFSPREKSDRVT